MDSTKTQLCVKYENCGFFKKYQKTSNYACKGFITMYCQGPKQDQCKRKEHSITTGTPPPDNMMPNGRLL